MVAPNLFQVLPTLDKAELVALRDRATALLGKNDSTVDADAEQLVHDAVADVLRSAGERSVPPLFRIRSLAHYDSFRKGAPTTIAFIDEYLRPKTKLKRLQALRILLKMAARDLGERGIPVAHKTMSGQLERIARVVDRQFPGYRESGLLPALLGMKLAMAAA